MKRSSIIILLIMTFFLFSCSSKESENKIAKITYQTIDYMGGYTQSYIIDFDRNEFLRSHYIMEEDNSELTVVRSFSEEEEKVFINGITKNGLLNLKERYEPAGIVYDGGGWVLEIVYVDGEIKKSTGKNASPKTIFNNCSTYFYDLCKEEVLGMLPKYYKEPPQISVSFRGNSFNGNGYNKIYKIAYKWNKNVLETNDLFELCKSTKTEFEKDVSYKVVFYTANYDYEKKFDKFVLISFDNNNELSNKKTISENKWFKQIEFELEIDKIYVFELHYENGDFVQYAFSTEVN